MNATCSRITTIATKIINKKRRRWWRQTWLNLLAHTKNIVFTLEKQEKQIHARSPYIIFMFNDHFNCFFYTITTSYTKKTGKKLCTSINEYIVLCVHLYKFISFKSRFQAFFSVTIVIPANRSIILILDLSCLKFSSSNKELLHNR